MKPTTVSTSIGASGFSAALVVMAVWAFKSGGVNIPADVAAAMGTILTGLVHYIVSFEKPASIQLPAIPEVQLVSPVPSP